MSSMDFTKVDWVLLALLSAFVFVAFFVGNILSFKSRLWGAIVTTIIFAILYVIWYAYPHGFTLPVWKT